MFLIRLFLTFIFISNVLAKTLPDSFYTDPIQHIAASLAPLLQFSQHLETQDIENIKDLSLKIEEAVKSLSYSKRLESKIIHFLMVELCKPKFNINNLDLGIASLFDFVDLLQMLKIPIKDSGFLEPHLVEEILLYQTKHFPLEGTIQNLINVIKNNFQLYTTWRNRAKDKPKGFYDIPIPEAKAVYFYYIAFFDFYKEMFKTREFKRFLGKRQQNYLKVVPYGSRRLTVNISKFNPDLTIGSEATEYTNLKDYLTRLILESEKFYDLGSSEESNIQKNLSYLKLHKMDTLYRAMIDSTFGPIKQIEDVNLKYENDMNFELNEDSEQFYLFSIGELSEASLLMTLGVTRLHLLDTTQTLTPNHRQLYNLRKRRQHDYTHSNEISLIYKRIDAYQFYENEEYFPHIQYALLRFLEFCEVIFTEQENQMFIKHIVNLHHEQYLKVIPISKDFVSRLLEEDFCGSPDFSVPFGEYIGLDKTRKALILKSWHRVWKSLPLKIEK